VDGGDYSRIDAGTASSSRVIEWRRQIFLGGMNDVVVAREQEAREIAWGLEDVPHDLAIVIYGSGQPIADNHINRVSAFS